MSQKLLRLSFLQFSGILGVGIFYLPYIFYKSNLYFSILGLVLATYLTHKVNTSYLKVITRFQDTHQLPGYVELILGRKFAYLAKLNLLLLSGVTLLALSSTSLSFLSYLFPNISTQIISILLLSFISILHITSIKKISLFQLFPAIFLLLPIFLLAQSNLPRDISFTPFNFNFFGFTMFALSGFTVLPQMWIISNKNLNSTKILRRSSFLGLCFASATYSIFALSIVLLSRNNIDLSPVLSLAQYPFLASLVAVFGVLTTTLSSLNFLDILRTFLKHDLGLHSSTALFLPILFLLTLIIFYNSYPAGIVEPLATSSVLISVLLIFIMRLKLGPTSLFKKTMIAITTGLFLYTTIMSFF